MIAIDLVRRINQTLLEKFPVGFGLGIAISGRVALCCRVPAGCWPAPEGVLAK